MLYYNQAQEGPYDVTTPPRNAAMCRICSDVIESRGVHDFVVCACGAIAVDGGPSYLKRSGDPRNFLPAPPAKETKP